MASLCLKSTVCQYNKGGGKVLPGLVTRRADEAELYGRVA